MSTKLGGDEPRYEERAHWWPFDLEAEIDVSVVCAEGVSPGEPDHPAGVLEARLDHNQHGYPYGRWTWLPGFAGSTQMLTPNNDNYSHAIMICEQGHEWWVDFAALVFAVHDAVATGQDPVIYRLDGLSGQAS